MTSANRLVFPGQAWIEGASLPFPFCSSLIPRSSFFWRVCPLPPFSEDCPSTANGARNIIAVARRERVIAKSTERKRIVLFENLGIFISLLIYRLLFEQNRLLLLHRKVGTIASAFGVGILYYSYHFFAVLALFIGKFFFKLLLWPECR